MRPRVLFLACHLPWPAISGGRRRELELIRRAARDFDIHLIVVSKTPEEDRDNAAALRGICSRVEIFAADRLGGPSADSQEGRGEPRAVRRHRCRAAGRRVAEVLARESVDLVHVEGFYLMQHLPRHVEIPVLLVEQNVEHDLERQRAAASKASITWFDAFAHHLKTREVEIACWERADRLGAITPEDRELIVQSSPPVPVTLLPDGADHIPSVRNVGRTSAPERPDAPLVVFLANFAYAPNVDAARFLCREIVPRTRRAVPDLHVWLVGNAPPPEVCALQADRVRVTGFVPDVLPYLDAADAVVCPLRIGGGIKVKAIEALRRGKAIVSTSIGAQGLPVAAREALARADSTEDFIGALSSVLLDRGRQAELERRAAAAGAALPSWDEAAEMLASTYRELLSDAEEVGMKNVLVGRRG